MRHVRALTWRELWVHRHMLSLAQVELPAEGLTYCRFRPHVMTALMGTTGAGKTTLMDLLACRKNSAPALQKELNCATRQHSLALA